MIERAVAKDPARALRERRRADRGRPRARRARRRRRPGCSPSTPEQPTARDRRGRPGRRAAGGSDAGGRQPRRRGRGRVLAAIAVAFVVQQLFGGDGVSVSAPIAVGHGPLRIATGERSVWVTSARDGTLTRIDPTTGDGRRRAAAARQGRLRRRRSAPARSGSRARAPARCCAIDGDRHGSSAGSTSAAAPARSSSAAAGSGSPTRTAPASPRSTRPGGRVFKRGIAPARGAAAPRRRRRRRLGQQRLTGTVRRIDLGTAVAGPPILAGRGPAGVTVGRGLVWVANSRSDSVTRVDPVDPARSSASRSRSANGPAASTPAPASSGSPTPPTTRSAASTSRAASDRRPDRGRPAPGRRRGRRRSGLGRRQRRRRGHPDRAVSRTIRYGSIEVMDQDIDQLCINTIRTLSIDAIQKANSGHPGHADGARPARLHALAALPALRPRRPDLARPRPLRALRRARLDAALLAALPGRGAGGRPRLRGRRRARRPPRATSKASASSTRARPATPSTAGPPGSRRRPARSARASPPRSGWRSPRKWQGARYGAELFDFDVYAIAGDGCLMEGVSGEAASLAGHLKLDNLCWVYDNNHITIDGRTDLAYDDDVAARFEGYGWNVVRVEDANDLDRIASAFEEFRAEEGRPTLIVVDSHIGWGSPHKVRHLRRPRRAARRGGGARDQARLRLARGRPVPRPRRGHGALRRGDRQARRRAAAPPGRSGSPRYAKENAGLAAEIEAMQKRELPDGWDAAIPSFDADEKGIATRKASQQGPERDRRAAALAARRLRRPHRLDLGPLRLRRRRRLRARRLRRPPAPLRDPRARVGGDLQRPLALQAAAALVDLPDLLRLRPAGDPALGADGAAGDPPLHPRLDRARRGRPDPPAGRAARLAAGDPRPRRDPARRRQRGRRGLAGGDRPHPPAGRPGPHPPERAGPRPLASTPRPRGCGAAATCSPTPRAATPR